MYKLSVALRRVILGPTHYALSVQERRVKLQHRMRSEVTEANRRAESAEEALHQLKQVLHTLSEQPKPSPCT